ncbi:MAG: cyclic nucleotide-binding domain-containing protein [Deltaproteobacteria bacterium]|nr:cyclic nucleotide-binding domain-containing protein [Deltaproteobacteria bacterium]
MDVHQFTHALQQLLRVDLDGVSAAERGAIVRAQLALAEDAARPLDHRVAFVPFVPGRRPVDEIRAPGLGSSEAIGLLGGAAPDHLTVLYRLSRAGQPLATVPDGLRLLATLHLLDGDGRPTRIVPGWDARPITAGHLGDVPDGAAVDRAFALRLDVDPVFEPLIHERRDPAAAFGFGSLFFERFRLVLALVRDGATLATDAFEFEIFDERGFGSLYARIADRLLPDDLRRQCAENGREVGIAFHPWFPVLCIGVAKANLYMKAIRGDVVREHRMLTDPAWLLRVGLYLELLTCLGIIEAVRATLDLLSPEERALFEGSPRFAELRRRIDRTAWTRVWELRGMAFLRTPGLDMPVGIQNLLRKKSATLAFLHAHHDDLKHAIAFAGANRMNAQETWQRVFRDAERATLTMNQEAFPELGYLPESVRRFVLWHRQGSAFGFSIGATLAGAFGDQDGLYPSACTQYRDSMNMVAAWAAERGLMEYTGDECVPRAVSLLESHLTGNHVRLAQLQRRDGYQGTLELRESDEAPRLLPPDEIRARIVGIALFRILTRAEVEQLARLARTITLGPTERILVQGNPGSSLFVLHAGKLEVIVKADGRERVVAELQPGAVVGEVAFLTGQPRTATVRAVDGATVIEIAARHLEPIVRERPVILDELTALMTSRTEVAEAALSPAGLLERLAAAIFGG